MELQKGKLKRNKYPTKCSIAIETPIAMDLSTDITRLFQVNLHKKRRISEYMCESIRKTKLHAGADCQSLDPHLPIFRLTTSKEFVEFSEKVPQVEMSRHLVKCIKKMIKAPNLEESHPQIVAEMIKEAREEYAKVLRCSGINQKIKNSYPEVMYKIEPYKYLGRTDRYGEYLLTRKQLKTKWMLHYPIIKKVFKECVTKIPQELCHLNFDKILELDEIMYTLKDKHQSVSQFIYEFYVKILSLVDKVHAKESTKRRNSNSHSYLFACTGILSVHISKAIVKTLLHIVKFTHTNQPYIALNITFDKGLVLAPTVKEVIAMYHDFIEKVIYTGKEIYVLQRDKVKGYENKYMPLCITEEFVSNCKSEVTENIERLYEPVTLYLENLSEDLKQIYPDINSKGFIESISDITFEHGCERIMYYREYLNKVAYIPDHEYFQIGQMFLTEYRTNLSEGLKLNIDSIYEKLCSQHLWEVNDLYEIFNMIHMRANQKPLTTEELIETGKYMNWIKNEHLEEITTRVESSLASLCQIIDLGFLNENHMDLNAYVINWLDKISPVVEEHLVNFDQLKFDAEEKLQKIVEDVNALIKAVDPLLVMLDDMDDITKVNSYLHIITLHMAKIKEIDEQIVWINKEEVCLSFPKSTYTEYDNLKNYVYPFYHLLKLCLDIQRNVSVWQDGPFENLNYDLTKSSIEDFSKELTELHKSYRKKLRQAQDENLPIRFKGTIDDPDILNWPAPLKLCGKAMKLLDDFKPSVNVTKIICNTSLRKRHWKAMSEIAGVDITPNAGTTLRKMMTIDFYAHLNEYEIISAGATKEKQLIDSLRALELIWQDIKFTVTKFKEIKILTQLDEIEAVIDDHSIKILNMKGSVFVKPHKEEVLTFYSKILQVSKTIDVWNNVQTQWVRLLPIFSTNHLSEVIPKEAELVSKVMSVYNEYMEKISKKPTVIKIVETTNILTSMQTCLRDIEIVYQGVVAYLETIRQECSRLYFISDDELLCILSEDDPLKSQDFLSTIFLAVSQLVIDEGEIMGFESSFGERVIFVEAIDVNNNLRLEKLCCSIEHEMVKTLKHNMTECYKMFKRDNLQQILVKFPQQIIQVISQIYWTEHIKTALGLTHNIKLRIYYQKLENTVNEKNEIINVTSTTNLQRLVLRNLILDDLNLRYLVQKMLACGYINENQLDWEAHPKYHIKNALTTVQLLSTHSSYMYEYIGNNSPIIMTPLTDRCYRTLVNAHQMYFAGLLQGPGDSGKSEIMRSLAAIFGVFFVTFNCLQKLNISTLVKFIMGSALCGSWLCLENINILESGVLSIMAQHMFTILSAVQSGSKRCSLGNGPLRIEPTWFVTACIKTTYLHKELPDNLRVLFRTSTLASPDIPQIIETMCYSFGLQNAKPLSKKMIYIYNTYHDIMVSQAQYYFGISTVKKIFWQYEYMRSMFLEETEESVLFNSIQATIKPTMASDDVEIFDELLRNVFPDVNVFSENKTDLEEHILKYFEENNLQHNKEMSRKIIETYDCLKRGSTGVILLGETFTGKTTIINICEYLWIKLENEIIAKSVINPNSVDYNDLYGKFNNVSQHWTDGIVSKTLRNFSMDQEKSRNWLILDGNIDCSWIENINDILYGNRFYLESGETLNLKDATVIFEIKNIDAATPSTISRCSIIYIPPSTLTWKEFTKSWIHTCQSEWIDEYRELILDLINWIIPPSLEFIESNCKLTCDLNQINLVTNMIHLTNMTLDEAFLSIARKEEDIKNLYCWIQATLISTGIAGLGSVLDRSSMQKFDEFYRLLWKGQNKDNPYPASFEKLEVIMPQEGLLCDYQYLFKQRGIWKMYQDLLKNEKIIEHPYMNDFLVPTADTLKFGMFLTMQINNQQPTLIVGPQSTGKTLLIEHILINSVDKERHEVSYMNFNCNTNSKDTQNYVISKLNKRKNGRYSPPVNKNFLLFIDNLNLLTTDQHNSSPTLELIRQYFDNGIWYDLKHYNPIYLERINIISAMNPSAVRRKKLCKRFLRHFDVYSLDTFSDDALSRIYSNVLLQIWKKSGFPSDITSVISQIIAATIKIYHSILNKFKPTMGKFYYSFDLSDFSKVIRGCGNLKKETYDGNKKIYLNLWSHEVQRVFGDRLNCFEVKWLLDDIKNIMKEEFNEEEEQTEEKSSDANNKLQKIIFGTFNDREVQVDDRRYEEIIDIQNLENLFSESLKIYNNSHPTPLDVIFFAYAFEKLVKICRVLSTPLGNALLLGEPETGRQSLTKLASHLYNQTLFQPTVVTGYSLKEWNSDVKQVLKEAGGLEKQCVFLVTQEQLIDEQFLQNLDFFLRKGEIPNLYDAEEKQEVLELTRLSAQGGNRNLDISSSDVFLYFNKKCKENLHLIICHSINTVLRNRIRRHPALLNCHVICFENWPDESLECVGRTWTKDLNLTNDIKEKIIESSIYFHRQSQVFAHQLLKNCKIHMYISPKTFIHQIRLFAKLVTVKQNEIKSMTKRYQQGLAKLSHAAKQILDMQKCLAEYQPQLEAMTRKAIEMTEQIALETIQVEKASALVRKDEQIAGEQAAVAQVLKSECEAELAQAIPILEDAISALNTLKPSDITLVKSMKNPPDAIKLVMAAVCVIKDVKPERIPDPSTGRKTIDYWGPSKRILGDMNFLQSLKDFDKDHIKPDIMVKIRKEYLPHKDFKPHVVAKASSAAEGLCKWIIAMDMYDKVAKEVAPKKEKLEKAEREYAETMAVLNEKKEELTRLEQKLAELNETLADAKQKQQKLQKEVDYCNKKLNSAQKLIGSLSEERVKWTESAKSLQTQYELLPGNILFFSGLIAYLAPINQENRKHILNIWQDYVKEKLIAFSDDYDVTKLFSSEKEIEFWLRNKIPNDNFFITNAIILKYSRYYSMFIDPQYQASGWIQKVERKNKIVLTKFTDSDCLEKLRDAISSGRPILVNKVKHVIPPCLINLLQRQTVDENEESFVKLNNEQVRMDTNFRFYMASNLRSPHFSPEMYNRITLINFEMTESALEEELLKTVVEIEKPKLKSLKKDIAVRNKKDKAELLELEERILNTLCESDSDILEDQAAIKILDESKDLVKEVYQRKRETELLQTVIDEFKEGYKDVAKYSANLFYCVNELKNLNYIYEFSFDWYMDQYFRSVLNARISKNIQQRIANIKNGFTYGLYVSLKNTLLGKDRPVFLFLLSTRVLLFEKKISKQDLQMFLIGTWTERKHLWTNQSILNCLEQIEELECFKGFLNDLKINTDTWRIFFENLILDIDNFPVPWNAKLSNFHKLILIKLLRPDQIFHNIKKFIVLELGEKYFDIFYVNLSDIYNDSYSLSPIMLFLQSGFNFTQKLNDLARKKQVINRFRVLSLSKTQTYIIDNLIDNAQKQGSWILVQNCHLVPSWLQKLDERIVEMNVENTHENFRLWLTTKPCKEISIELLQSSAKVNIEEPEDMKTKLKRIYKSEPIMNTDFYNACPEQLRYFTRLLYALSFFHCVLQNRRNFGSISSNTPYIFSDDDLYISLHQLQINVSQSSFSCNHLEKLIYLIGNCHYAGNIDNKFDNLLVVTLLKDFLEACVGHKDKCLFSDLESYGFPKKNDYKDYLLHTSKLPSPDDPRLFGVNDFILSYAAVKSSRIVISSIYDVLQQKKEEDLKDQQFQILTKIDDILNRLPSCCEFETTSINNIAVKREMELYRMLLDVISNSLIDLKDAFSGNCKITLDIEWMAKNIIDNVVPSEWLRNSYPNLMNLACYIEDLCQRIDHFRRLIQNPEGNTFWLGAFLLPRAFICQTKMDFSKKLKIPPENLVFDYEVLNYQKSAECNCVIFHGLFIKGASWKRKLGELKNVYETFPPIIFKPISETDFSKNNQYVCPIYQTDNVVKRDKYLGISQNFISTVLLPTDVDSSHWVKLGVKLICQAPKETNFSI